MDKATIGGTVSIWLLILGSILYGGPLGAFLDVPSALIVLAGSPALVFIGFPAEQVIGGFKAGKIAISAPPLDPTATIKQLAELSNRARREGLLSLEAAADSASDPFLARGLRMMADGHEAATIESVLYDEIGKIEERHKGAAAVFEGLGAYGPAMGMIGTLIGLVQMLQNMSDPTSIGPAMAVALLTTLYGSLLANLIGIPIANKLKVRSSEELAYKELVAQGLLSILAGENPRFMVERLNATLAPAQRLSEAA